MEYAGARTGVIAGYSVGPCSSQLSGKTFMNSLKSYLRKLITCQKKRKKIINITESVSCFWFYSSKNDETLSSFNDAYRQSKRKLFGNFNKSRMVLFLSFLETLGHIHSLCFYWLAKHFNQFILNLLWNFVGLLFHHQLYNWYV